MAEAEITVLSPGGHSADFREMNKQAQRGGLYVKNSVSLEIGGGKSSLKHRGPIVFSVCTATPSV